MNLLKGIKLYGESVFVTGAAMISTMVTGSDVVTSSYSGSSSHTLRLAEMEKQTTRSRGGSYCIAPGCSNELYRAKAVGVIVHFTGYL